MTSPDAAPLEAADPLALESQICFALSVASRSVVAAYRPVLEPLGLTHPQYLVMLALWQGPTLTLRALAETLRLDPGTLSPLVKRLESQGLVTRRRGSADERTLAIALTPAGAALRGEAESIPSRMMRRLGVERDELVLLHRTMSKLIAAAES
ncbi:MarR family transcriptional regulator [Frigoribacterium sp. Leaf263]|uniref:MarR family winged helix-turn-helix transcriptional regulator n=1 Tax=Frigoribacterium sp. Leaf263 TaxID=1736313 RepID=UPI0006FAC721|nr:MarR family transcriptional regulator [Frigoribacterium sp. Leaf263]KQO84348.1 MarR family transcriptional regulator [Frigoribacterium sp. Leaf263]